MAIQRDPTTELNRWTRIVADSALTFERRWTDLALQRVDGAMARLLHEQIGIFDEACLTGTIEQIAVHGSATCRGYAAAVRVMDTGGVEGKPVPDDSYQLGSDPVTGCKVAIGHHKGIVERVQELHGSSIICITPDEVAVMVGSVDAIKGIGEIKRLFPGAEIIRKLEGEST
jgi:hypothetical protein